MSAEERPDEELILDDAADELNGAPGHLFRAGVVRLHRLLVNLQLHRTDPKFFRLKMCNHIVRSEMLACPGVRPFLSAVGFKEERTISSDGNDNDSSSSSSEQPASAEESLLVLAMPHNSAVVDRPGFPIPWPPPLRKVVAGSLLVRQPDRKDTL